MKRAALALLLCLVATAASAGTSFSGAPNTTAKFAAFYPYRKIRLCLIPDTQNITNEGGEQSGEIILHNPSTSCALNILGVPSQDPRADLAAKSRYCEGSWGNTGEILVNNMAYELAGQYDKIDWRSIPGTGQPTDGPIPGGVNQQIDDPRGDFTARSHWWNQHSGISGCDAIIGLGDIVDEDEVSDDSYDNKDAQSKREWNRALVYWKIIKGSRIPYIPNRGNHDSRDVFANWFMPALNFNSESFFFAEEATRKTAHAILIPMTNAGKPLCIVSNNLGNVGVQAIPVNSTEMAFVNTNVGCGNNYPTIVVAHDLVFSATTHDAPAGGATPTYDTIVTANPEIFMFAGGHWLISSVAGISGAGVIHVYSNFQEEPRHLVAPDGWTGRDSGGDIWRAVIIDPRYNTVLAYDWTPYWDASGANPSYYTSPSHPAIAMTKQVLSFNWDARFP